MEVLLQLEIKSNAQITVKNDPLQLPKNRAKKTIYDQIRLIQVRSYPGIRCSTKIPSKKDFIMKQFSHNLLQCIYCSRNSEITKITQLLVV